MDAVILEGMGVGESCTLTQIDRIFLYKKASF